MRGSLTLGRVRGIPVRAHVTLLIVLPYLAFLMSARFEQVAHRAGVTEGALTVPPLAWGLLLAMALFGCVLLHELGHALVALRQGGRVQGITLMLLGGVSELRGLPHTPRAEGLVAVAGPLVSFALAGLAFAIRAALPMPGDAAFGLYYLGQINLALGIFNLLPAFPMDGGRVLRALLSTRLSRIRATRWAANAGLAFAAIFVVLGLLGGNLILALIGLFVMVGATAERDAVEREEQLGDLVVRDVMSPVRVTAEGWEPASTVAARMVETQTTAMPVLDDGRLVGIVSVHHLESLAPYDLERTPARALVEAAAPRLHGGEPLATALERMQEQNVGEAPVFEHGELVGVLEASDLGRALRLRRVAHPRFQPMRPPPVARPGAEQWVERPQP